MVVVFADDVLFEDGILQTDVISEPVKVDVEAALRSAVTNFSESPLRNGKIMRELVESHYGEFRAAAVAVLRNPDGIRGCRYLVTILWTHDLLIPILGDYALPKELGRAIAQTAAKVDSQLHIRLIRFLVTGMIEGKELEEASANRLLEILSSIADGPGIHRFIRRMLQHPSPRIRSKVTLLVERGGPGVRALAALVEDPNEDTRVRANALEALWFADSPEVPAIFRSCLGDPNNRVLGNAVLGLYLAGDPQSIRALFDMAAATEPLLQTTAVWTMGRTKDPRFLSCAGRFMVTSRGMLRRTAFHAVESIKKAAAERARNPRFRANVLNVEELTTRTIRLRVALTYPSSAAPVIVAPTAFIVQAGSEQITDFSCSEQKSGLLCVAFVVPNRAVADAFRAVIDTTLRLCLESKGKTEQWAVARCQETEGLFQESQPVRWLGQTLSNGRNAAETAKPLVFTMHGPTIRASLEPLAAGRGPTPDSLEALRSAFASTVPSRAARHAILFVDAALRWDDEAAEQLIADAKEAHFSISALSVMANPTLARVCGETGGAFRRVSEAADLQLEMPLIYAGIRSQYILEFPNTGPEGVLPSRITLSVHAKDAIGEGTWEVGSHAESSPDSNSTEQTLVP